MCDMDPPSDPASVMERLLGDMPKLAQCRHVCRCGCHTGALKHAASCTSCVACGHGHAAVARIYLQEHLLACHRITATP